MSTRTRCGHPRYGPALRTTAPAVIAALVALVVPASAVAQEPLAGVLVDTLRAEGTDGGEEFGFATAISRDGTRAVAGALRDEVDGAVNAGTARVFLAGTGGWMGEATFRADDAEANEFLGISVGISEDGSRAIVGVSGEDSDVGENSGAARIFLRTGASWALEAVLDPPTRQEGAQFGFSVAMDDDGRRVVVSANLFDLTDAESAGAAWVFVRDGTTWTEEARLEGSALAGGDAFGRAVAISGDGTRAVVGSHVDDTDDGENAGSVYVFARSDTTWSEEANLMDASGNAGDLFGTSVAFDQVGQRLLVGAPLDTPFFGQTNEGSVVVFTRDGTTWTQEARLSSPDSNFFSQFGFSVALDSSGERALVGNWLETRNAVLNGGTAEVFVRTAAATWEAVERIVVPDTAENDRWGRSVALSGDGTVALVGGHWVDTLAGDDAGAVSVYMLEEREPLELGERCDRSSDCRSRFCFFAFCTLRPGTDGGPVDAGAGLDSGVPDAAPDIDAGRVDAGAVLTAEAGPTDAGTNSVDGGAPDPGDGGGGGCAVGYREGTGGATWLLVATCALLLSRRRRRPGPDLRPRTTTASIGAGVNQRDDSWLGPHQRTGGILA